jgi:diacylglycerol kinase (ATP)
VIRTAFEPRTSGGPIVVIVNPQASRLRGPQRGARILGEVEAWAREAAGGPPVVIRVEDRTAIDAAGRQAMAAGAGLVVAVGGDGTVAALAGDLAGTGIPLAIVPGGTGNVLASALGIPNSPSQAIRALNGAQRRSIDLGSAVMTGAQGDPAIERMFAVAAGVGWDARVMAATAGSHKRRLGKLAYWVAALGLLDELTPVPYVIEVDERRYELEATVALIANAGELIPGRVRPRLPIVPDDGLLDLLVLRVASLTGGARGALELLDRTELGGSPSGQAFRARGRRIRVVAEPAQPRQVDGDGYGSGPLEVAIRPGALDVLGPPVVP